MLQASGDDARPSQQQQRAIPAAYFEDTCEGAAPDSHGDRDRRFGGRDGGRGRGGWQSDRGRSGRGAGRFAAGQPGRGGRMGIGPGGGMGANANGSFMGHAPGMMGPGPGHGGPNHGGPGMRAPNAMGPAGRGGVAAGRGPGFGPGMGLVQGNVAPPMGGMMAHGMMGMGLGPMAQLMNGMGPAGMMAGHMGMMAPGQHGAQMGMAVGPAGMGPAGRGMHGGRAGPGGAMGPGRGGGGGRAGPGRGGRDGFGRGGRGDTAAGGMASMGHLGPAAGAGQQVSNAMLVGGAVPHGGVLPPAAVGPQPHGMGGGMGALSGGLTAAELFQQQQQQQQQAQLLRMATAAASGGMAVGGGVAPVGPTDRGLGMRMGAGGMAALLRMMQQHHQQHHAHPGGGSGPAGPGSVQSPGSTAGAAGTGGTPAAEPGALIMPSIFAPDGGDEARGVVGGDSSYSLYPSPPQQDGAGGPQQWPRAPGAGQLHGGPGMRHPYGSGRGGYAGRPYQHARSDRDAYSQQRQPHAAPREADRAQPVILNPPLRQQQHQHQVRPCTIAPRKSLRSEPFNNLPCLSAAGPVYQSAELLLPFPAPPGS